MTAPSAAGSNAADLYMSTKKQVVRYLSRTTRLASKFSRVTHPVLDLCLVDFACEVAQRHLHNSRQRVFRLNSTGSWRQSSNGTAIFWASDLRSTMSLCTCELSSTASRSTWGGCLCLCSQIGVVVEFSQPISQDLQIRGDLLG